MKKRKKAVSTLCGVLLAIPLVFSGIPKAVNADLSTEQQPKTKIGVCNTAEEYVANGGFENGFYGWEKTEQDMVYLTNAESNSGCYSLTAYSENRDCQNHGAYQNITLAPNTSYTLSFYLRSNSYSVDAGVKITIPENDINYFEGGYIAYTDMNDTDYRFLSWTRMEVSFQTDEHTAYRLAIQIRNNSDVILDDFSIAENLIADPGFNTIAESSFNGGQWVISENCPKIERGYGGNSGESQESDGTYNYNSIERAAIRIAHENKAGFFYTDFKVKPSSLYTLSFWVRGNQLTRATGYYFGWCDPEKFPFDSMSNAGDPQFRQYETALSDYQTDASGVWVKIEKNFFAGEAQTSARVFFRFSADAGCGLGFDEVSVTKCNGIKNGDFETVCTDGELAENWFSEQNGDKPETTKTDTEDKSQNHCLALSAENADDKIYIPFAVKPNTAYCIRYRFQNSGDAALSCKIGDNPNNGSVLTLRTKNRTAGWETAESIFTSGGHSLLYLTFAAENGTPTIRIDDVEVAKINRLPDNALPGQADCISEKYSLTVNFSPAASKTPCAEYSSDGVVWQRNNTISGLDSGKAYTIFYRAAANGSYAAGEKRQISLTTLPEYGDLNNDKTVNGVDLILMQKYLLGAEKNVNTVNGNVNNSADGTVDLLDLIHLKKYFTHYAPY